MNNHRDMMQKDDVVTVLAEDRILINHKTFTVDELLSELSQRITGENIYQMKKWCMDGVSCQILSPNQNWRKGKVKFCLEFVPDEAESPLDDIRQQINNNVGE